VRAVAARQLDAPRFARPFVAAFLLTLVVCTLVPLNPWPFSDWELFSRLRTGRESAWEAIAVESSGRRLAYPVASLAHGYHGFASTMASFSGRSAASRNSTCEGWLRAATKQLGTNTSLFRIYEVSWLLSGRHGTHRAPRHRTLEWTCRRTGAYAMG
jgi:hypothetical protein